MRIRFWDDQSGISHTWSAPGGHIGRMTDRQCIRIRKTRRELVILGLGVGCYGFKTHFRITRKHRQLFVLPFFYFVLGLLAVESSVVENKLSVNLLLLT